MLLAQDRAFGVSIQLISLASREHCGNANETNWCYVSIQLISLASREKTMIINATPHKIVSIQLISLASRESRATSLH